MNRNQVIIGDGRDVMTGIESRLNSLGLSLPEAAKPAANYVPFVISEHQVFVAGQIPFLNGERAHIGKLGQTMDIEGGRRAAEACALNLLAQALAAAGDETRLARCVKLVGFVNCTPDFTDIPAVINGASDLIVHAMGERGRHARSAVGVGSLPFGVAVEVEAVFELAV